VRKEEEVIIFASFFVATPAAACFTFEVGSAKNAVFELPAQATEIIPAGKLPVDKFVELLLPRTSSDLVYGESGLWFSRDEPTTNISLLMGRSIPPAAVLELLDRKAGQAWLDGAKSMAIGKSWRIQSRNRVARRR